MIWAYSQKLRIELQNTRHDGMYNIDNEKPGLLKTKTFSLSSPNNLFQKKSIPTPWKFGYFEITRSFYDILTT
jgi:hypothetical protein